MIIVLGRHHSSKYLSSPVIFARSLNPPLVCMSSLSSDSQCHEFVSGNSSRRINSVRLCHIHDSMSDWTNEAGIISHYSILALMNLFYLDNCQIILDDSITTSNTQISFIQPDKNLCFTFDYHHTINKQNSTITRTCYLELG